MVAAVKEAVREEAEMEVAETVVVMAVVKEEATVAVKEVAMAAVKEVG